MSRGYGKRWEDARERARGYAARFGCKYRIFYNDGKWRLARITVLVVDGRCSLAGWKRAHGLVYPDGSEVHSGEETIVSELMAHKKQGEIVWFHPRREDVF